MIKIIAAILILINSFAIFAGNLGSDPVKAELIAASGSIRPGEEFYIGVKFTISKGWHIYWLNPGDSGIPTEIDLELPEGISIKQIYWPPPGIIKSSGLTSFGYTGAVIVPVKLAAGSLSEGNIRIKAKASWLACKEKCIPGNANTSITLRVDADSKDINKANEILIDKAMSDMPLETEGWQFSARKEDNSVFLAIIPPPWFDKSLKKVDFIPFTEGIFSTSGQQLIKLPGKSYSLEIALDQYRSQEPEYFEALIYTGNNWLKNSKNKYLYVKVPIITN